MMLRIASPGQPTKVDHRLLLLLTVLLSHAGALRLARAAGSSHESGPIKGEVCRQYRHAVRQLLGGC